MKTKVFGKEINRYYDVQRNTKEINTNGIKEQIFIKRPKVTVRVEEKCGKQLCEYEGEPKYSKDTNNLSFYISENEQVYVVSCKFRADLNEWHILTDKITSENEINKEEAKNELEELLCMFNEQIISSDERLTNYCNLHKLKPENTDCEELFDLVYPNCVFYIDDDTGKLEKYKYNDSFPNIHEILHGRGGYQCLMQ